MDFITITQYFNKLHSALLVLLIVPLLVFIALYFFLDELPTSPAKEYLIIIPTAVLIDWLVAMLIFNKKIKSVGNEQGLGIKLDKYFKITIVRYSLLSSGSFILALGFYLYGSDLLTALYLAGLVLAGILWPTGRKVCSDLRLKGDEREMVYFKKDVF
jgi:hypothetical protein